MLTVTSIKKLKPKSKLYRRADQHGLCVEVRPNGRKYWRFRFRFGGAAQMMSLGEIADIDLMQARKLHLEATRLLRQGKNPITEQRVEKLRGRLAQSHSFQAIATEWLNKKRPSWTHNNFIKEEGRLVNHAYPHIGKLPINDITTAHVWPLLDSIVRRGTLDTAHRVRQTMSSVFRFAVAREMCNGDPAFALKDELEAHHKRNYSYITNPQILGDLLRSIDGFRGQFQTHCGLRLAPLLFLRPGELRNGEWNEVDLKKLIWVIPPERLKLRKALKLNPNSEPHLVPLSTQALSILQELRSYTGDGKYMFPGARDTKRPMSEATLNAALQRLGFSTNEIQPHGFRHTASTLLNELGFDSDLIEAQLGHAKKGVRGIYNKAKYLPRRLEMMQAWSNYLDDLKKINRGVL